MSFARKQLEAYSRAYADACARNYEAAQRLLDNANRIHEHVRSGKDAGECPTPMPNEISHQVERFAARVDAMLMTVYLEEMTVYREEKGDES